MFYLLNGIVRHQFVGGFWKRFSCVDRFVRFDFAQFRSVVLNCDDQHLMRLVIHLGKRGEELVLILNLSRRFEHARKGPADGAPDAPVHAGESAHL